VKVRALFPLAAAAGLWIPASVSADQPANLPASLPASATNPNQQLADAVAYRLRLGDTTGTNITISTQDGTVTLSGTARDAAQKERIVREARTVAGVITVRDALYVPFTGVVQVQQPPVVPVPPTPLGPIAQAPAQAPIAIPQPPGPIVEPAPLGIPGQITPDLQAPPLPPYAWPTYAPYNNASRIGYPEAYPYNAFPFIGPYYPFPKVPLGWRKVTLEWEDGHWYIGRSSAPHDYWRVKFWH
jgi:hypothetical protein